MDIADRRRTLDTSSEGGGGETEQVATGKGVSQSERAVGAHDV